MVVKCKGCRFVFVIRQYSIVSLSIYALHAIAAAGLGSIYIPWLLVPFEEMYVLLGDITTHTEHVL